MNHKTYSVPFMYIEQPDFKATEVIMQTDYYSVVKEQTRPKQPTESAILDDDTNFKDFKDLSIQEKIQYLLHLPGEMPLIHCEVETEEATHQGIVLEEQETEIMLRVFGKGYQTVEKEMITNINLIGF